MTTLAQDKLRVHHKGHTPHNKNTWEVNDGVAVLEVRDYDGSREPDAWTDITVTEMYTLADSKSGRVMSRCVSITLNEQERADLIKLLTR